MNWTKWWLCFDYLVAFLWADHAIGAASALDFSAVFWALGSVGFVLYGEHTYYRRIGA